MNEQLKSLLERFKIPLALSVVGIVLIVGGLVASGSQVKKDFPKESLVDKESSISVDVSGAVQNPGVYQLKMEARIEDAVQVAGGFSETANREYISKYLNMAQKLSDGAKVYIPAVGETGVVSTTIQAGVAGAATAKVNINSASSLELESLSGVGPVTASKIISGRTYQKVDELLGKKVVSKAVFEKIKDQVVVY